MYNIIVYRDNLLSLKHEPCHASFQHYSFHFLVSSLDLAHNKNWFGILHSGQAGRNKPYNFHNIWDMKPKNTPASTLFISLARLSSLSRSQTENGSLEWLELHTGFSSKYTENYLTNTTFQHHWIPEKTHTGVTVTFSLSFNIIHVTLLSGPGCRLIRKQFTQFFMHWGEVREAGDQGKRETWSQEVQRKNVETKDFRRRET